MLTEITAPAEYHSSYDAVPLSYQIRYGNIDGDGPYLRCYANETHVRGEFARIYAPGSEVIRMTVWESWEGLHEFERIAEEMGGLRRPL